MLGVETAQSDLDLLVTSFDCLIDRNKFFNEMEGLLKGCPQVEHLMIIRNANVPLAKFKFDGVKVDLVFAEMRTLKEIYSPTQGDFPKELLDPDYLLLESSLIQSNLKGADCINSYLSSTRLKLFIESLTEDQVHKSLLLRIFSEATRIIKCWAKRRAIYHFNFGFLNGISIMIMVAKVMHLMHKENAIQLDNVKVLIQNVVERFFAVYTNWPWTSTDVQARSIYLPAVSSISEFPWMTLSNYVMPIVCPYPPYKCTTVQMTNSSLAKIVSELTLAHQHIL